VASKLRISLTSLEGVLGSMLAEFYSMADYSTTARRIQIRFVGRLLGLTPATQRYKGRPCGIKTQDFADISGEGLR